MKNADYKENRPKKIKLTTIKIGIGQQVNSKQCNRNIYTLSSNINKKLIEEKYLKNMQIRNYTKNNNYNSKNYGIDSSNLIQTQPATFAEIEEFLRRSSASSPNQKQKEADDSTFDPSEVESRLERFLNPYYQHLTPVQKQARKDYAKNKLEKERAEAKARRDENNILNNLVDPNSYKGFGMYRFAWIIIAAIFNIGYVFFYVFAITYWTLNINHEVHYVLELPNEYLTENLTSTYQRGIFILFALFAVQVLINVFLISRMYKNEALVLLIPNLLFLKINSLVFEALQAFHTGIEYCFNGYGISMRRYLTDLEVQNRALTKLHNLFDFFNPSLGVRNLTKVGFWGDWRNGLYSQMYIEGSAVGDVRLAERLDEIIKNATIEDVAFNAAEKAAAVNQNIDDVKAAFIYIALFTVFAVMIAIIVITNKREGAVTHINDLTTDASRTIANQQLVPLEVSARARIDFQAIETERVVEGLVEAAKTDLKTTHQGLVDNLTEEGFNACVRVEAQGTQQSAAVRVAAGSTELQEQMDNIRQQGDAQISVQIAGLQQQGGALTAAMQQEGATQVAAVQQQGVTQIAATQQEGVTQIAAVQQQGANLQQQGNILQQEGTAQLNALQQQGVTLRHQGVTQSTALMDEGSTLSTNLQQLGDAQLGNLRSEVRVQIAAIRQQGVAQSAAVQQEGEIVIQNVQEQGEIIKQSVQGTGDIIIDNINVVGNGVVDQIVVPAGPQVMITIIVPNQLTGVVTNVVTQGATQVDPQAVAEAIPVIIPKIMEFLM